MLLPDSAIGFAIVGVIVLCVGAYSCGVRNQETDAKVKQAHIEQVKRDHEYRHAEEMAHVQANNSKTDKLLKWLVK